MIRIHTTANLSVGTNISLDENASHHLRNVLRAPLHSQIQLFNDLGQVCEGMIIELSRSVVTVQLIQTLDINTESPLDVTLVQSVSRGDRMDYTLQKCVELGVNKIIPVISSRTVVRLDERKKTSRLRHWAGIVKHATEQSGRVKVAALKKIQSLEDWTNVPTMGEIMILDPLAETSLAKHNLKSASVTLVAGPEGGFTKEELELIKKKKLSTSVSLGPRTLRSETAAVCAMSILQALWGDLV
jgi:16S rRNA (uracil1498-N3)-methyltransferase